MIGHFDNGVSHVIHIPSGFPFEGTSQTTLFVRTQLCNYVMGYLGGGIGMNSVQTRDEMEIHIIECRNSEVVS